MSKELKQYIREVVKSETRLLVEDRKRVINGQIDLEYNQFYLKEYKTLNQTVVALFDVLGWIPGLGSITSGINALIHLKNKKYFHAICYMISMIPFKGKLVGKAGKTFYKIFMPYYKLYKEGNLNAQDIIDEPSDDLVGFALAILEHETNIPKILYFFIDKEDVSEASEKELERFFDFLKTIKDFSESKEGNEN